MPLFNWSENFFTGIKEMDRQHTKLVGLINYLHHIRQNKTDDGILSNVFQELVEYTVTHLKTEEELLEKHDYPDLLSHKLEHKILIKKVLDMQHKYSSGKKDIAGKLAMLLNDWLAEHILTKDKKYGDYLSSKGIT